MNIELPEHLKSTADLLSKSLHFHPLDTAPAIPDELVSDLSRKFSHAQPSDSAQNSKNSLFAKLGSFLATPGFGLAAAAILILGFIAPALMTQNTESKETFRGANVTYAASKASIILITDNSETLKNLEDSGLFDMSIVIETTDPLFAASIQGAKLLVDVRGGAIVGYDADSREVLSDELPDDRSKIAEQIALAFGALQ
jgi:hypothetical protein